MDEIINLNDLFDRFQYECQQCDIICIRDMENLSTKQFYIGNELCRYAESKNKKGNYYQFTIGKSNKTPFNIDTDTNIPDFFIFRINDYPDNFWIIPKQRLIDEKVIGSSIMNGITDVNFPVPGSTHFGKIWLNGYLNNYDMLQSYQW